MAEASIAALRQALRAAAPESIPPLVKDVSVLVKLLRNPAEQPAETKFRVIKLSNATIARVLGTPGVRDVLQACGFVGDASSETLELREPLDSVTLLAAAEAVQAVQHMLQELYWLHVTRAAVPSLAAQPWSADGAAEAVMHACLGALHAPGPAAAKAEWVERLGHVLLAPEMVTCRAAVAGRLSVALAAVRSVALSLVRTPTLTPTLTLTPSLTPELKQVMEGSQDLRSLVLANRCLAQLWPPGDPHTLQARPASRTPRP